MSWGGYPNPNRNPNPNPNQVRGARWEPSYDLRVASDGEHVGLVAYGHVTQSSGEDWRDVRLSLSTADASEVALALALALTLTRPLTLTLTLPEPEP